jgi:hypothetical protein
MAALDEGRVGGIAPGIGVEMQAEDEVRLDGFVDDPGAGADFRGAVKQALGELAQRGGRVRRLSGCRLRGPAAIPAAAG